MNTRASFGHGLLRKQLGYQKQAQSPPSKICSENILWNLRRVSPKHADHVLTSISRYSTSMCTTVPGIQ